MREERTMLHELVDQLPDDRLGQALSLLEKLVSVSLRRNFKTDDKPDSHDQRWTTP
ncbi:hypothetical protein OOZ19_05210 [Saccharopolyspora sp. NFXS83]|uniref:hypothetical protein n=1 Tax=Saccharopolyspora sp. NFXS83 TaxID=2993560 RepID=UPI00224A9A06|nr:hypothetical protein [Saccharopolyspora sp. NFXS83]MCX2729627.1 hypothetical protein [Saccharopolyspora sp. NFXS83]